MIQNIDSSDFIDAFRAYGRADQFSHDGLCVLFDYLEDVNPNYELDVIELCCEYAEQPWRDVASDFDVDIDGLDETEAKQHVMNYLCDNTSVVGELNNGSFVYAQF